MSNHIKKLYALLEVTPDASSGTLKKAYYKLSQQYHPDINKEPHAEGKMKTIIRAYEVLTTDDKNKMQEYIDEEKVKTREFFNEQQKARGAQERRVKKKHAKNNKKKQKRK